MENTEYHAQHKRLRAGKRSTARRPLPIRLAGVTVQRRSYGVTSPPQPPQCATPNPSPVVTTVAPRARNEPLLRLYRNGEQGVESIVCHARPEAVKMPPVQPRHTALKVKRANAGEGNVFAL